MQQCENFFGIIVLQFVGRLLGDSVVGLLQDVTFSKRTCATHRASQVCFIDYTKAFDCVDHNKLWKILKEMGIPDHLTCPLRNLYAGQEVRPGQLELDMEQQTGSKLGKEYVKAVYCHPAYLTYMQRTS